MAPEKKKSINELLVETFNLILKLEQGAMYGTSFNNLTINEVHTIDAVGLKGNKTMTEIAADLGITVATLTKAISKLVQKGYVERKRTDEDRRVVMVRLTQKGTKVYRLHNLYHEKMIRITLGSMTQEEKNVLSKALEKLNKFFREEAEAVLNMKKEAEKLQTVED